MNKMNVWFSKLMIHGAPFFRAFWFLVLAVLCAIALYTALSFILLVDASDGTPVGEIYKWLKVEAFWRWVFGLFS